jgi:outer membrane lipoprotein-sorting protein
MTPEPNIEKALAELARVIGSDESLITNVMIRIEAKPLSRASAVNISQGNLVRRISAAAAALAIAILVILFARSTERDVWAAMCDALNKVNCAHLIIWQIDPNGQRTIQGEVWAKRPKLYRCETESEIVIDNGLEKLVLKPEEMTAQLKDSLQDQYPSTTMLFSFLQPFQVVRDPCFLRYRPVLVKVPSESTDEILVYDLLWYTEDKPRRPTEGKFRLWIDAKSLLLLRMLVLAEQNAQLDASFEWSLDYEDIPQETFSIDIPDGYRVLPRMKGVRVAGTILDKDGQPLADVEVDVIAGASHLTGRTGLDAAFEAKSQFYYHKLAFPILVRAFRKNEPNEVAWTIIQDPEDEKQVDFRVPDYGDVEISIDSNGPRFLKCSGIKGLVIEMQPALQVNGLVTDTNGNPIEDASVGVTNVRVRGTDSDGLPLVYYSIGASAVTDAHGNYLLGSLPGLPSGTELTIGASAKGYVPSHKSLRLDGSLQQNGSDFALLKAGVTIKGLVKNSAGEPLACYQVWPTTKGKPFAHTKSVDENGDVLHGSAFTDRTGHFELIDCPAVADLAVTAHGFVKPPGWDRAMQLWNMDRSFVYYNEKTVNVGFRPDCNEYHVEIQLDEADMTVQFEVKDPDGNPIPAAQVSLGVGSPSNKFEAATDEAGKCVFERLPWARHVHIHVRQRAKPRRYQRVTESAEFPENAHKYKIEVVLAEPKVTVSEKVTIRIMSD